MCIFINLFPNTKSHQVFAQTSQSTNGTNKKSANENTPVIKVKNNKSKEAYTYIKFHLDLCWKCT